MEKVLIFGHKNPDTDSICSSIVMERIAKTYGIDAEAVRIGNVNKETEYALNYVGIEATRQIQNAEEGQKVILVDHNEAPQSIDGRENLEVIAVIDHHRISDFSTAMPLYYIAKPYGCTSTLLYEICKKESIEIDKTMAKLMLSAIISDTLLLKSPTCTDKDVEAFKELEKIAEIDASSYGLEMLKAGTDLSIYGAHEVINLDAKEFNEKDKKIVIAQVNTADIEDVFARKEELSFEIEKRIVDDGLDLFVFVITDIINSNSKIIALGKDKELIEKAFGKKLDSNDAMMLEGVVSRKKQVAPQIISAI